MTTTVMTASEQRAYVREFAAGISGNFIDGRWTPSDSSETIEVFDPSTGETLGHVVASSEKDADAAVTAARAAQRGWAQSTPSARSSALLDE